MRFVGRGLMAGAAIVMAAGTLPGMAHAAAVAPAVVLVSQPARTTCAGGTFTVGVWYQRLSGGSRAYRVAVRGPRHTRFFYRHGQAPASGWLLWQVRAGRAGEYHTVYFGHRPGSTAWTRYRATTRARRCTSGA